MIKSDEVVARFTRRAEKLRRIASNVQDPEIREAMLIWAADYDRLADRAIQLPSPVAQINGASGAPIVKNRAALPADEPEGDGASATARWWGAERRWPIVLHGLGYGLTAAIAVAVIARAYTGGIPRKFL